MRGILIAGAALLIGGLTGCEPASTPAPPAAQQPPAAAVTSQALRAGAASVSLLPRVGGELTYLSALAPITDPVDPQNPGVYIDAFDGGRIDIDNGRSDAAWVHDDIRAAALALDAGGSRVVLLAADVYMIPRNDADAIRARARLLLPAGWQAAPILIGTTHNHHGPGTLFSVNDDWYDRQADNMAMAISDAVARLAPARLEIASGDHRFGVNDVRDPVIIDPRVHAIRVVGSGVDGEAIATVVQWSSHVESTLGWAPPAPPESICQARGWLDTDCTAEGRYITADYPGELRGRLEAELGGEVLYFVGAIGSQIGPGAAPVWEVTAEHPVGDGWTVPPGAQPVRGAQDFLSTNFAKAEAIGEALARRVIELLDDARPVTVPDLRFRSETFYTRLYQMGFRAAMASGELGWQDRDLYLCDGVPGPLTCRSDEGALVDDPIAGPVRAGEFLLSEVGYLAIDADSGMLFMPGEIAPELLIGLPRSFDEDPSPWYRGPAGRNARGSDYQFPGYVRSLIDADWVMAIGLGNDELGYFVPIADVRLPCVADQLAEPGTCAALHESGAIDWPEQVAGTRCRALIDRAAANDQAIAVDSAAAVNAAAAVNSAAALQNPSAELVLASCRYGAMFGQLYGYGDGHYEETNSAGIDLVDASWPAWQRLFPSGVARRINPDLPGFTPENPPSQQ